MLQRTVGNVPRAAPKDLSHRIVGVPDEAYIDEMTLDVANALADTIKRLEACGATVKRISLPTLALGAS